MKANIKIAKIYDDLLEETRAELVIEKDNKTYLGALFFEIQDFEKITEVIEEQKIDGTIVAILLTAYFMQQKYNLLENDDKTLKTMAHWQYINEFSNEMLNGYMYENDNDFLISLTTGL